MPKTILINFPTNIGDTAMALPVIDALRNSWPEAKITALASPKTYALLEKNSFIDTVKIFDKKWPPNEKLKFSIANFRKYEAVIDLKNSMLPLILGAKQRTPFLRLGHKSFIAKDIYLSVAKKFITAPTVRKSEIILSDSEITDYSYINDNSLFIACSSCSHLKRYNKNQLNTLISRLACSYPIVIAGSKNDQTYYENAIQNDNVINMLGKTTLPQLCRLIIEKAKILLCVDSGIMHIASYLNKPIVACFGPTNADVFGPWSEKNYVLKTKIKSDSVIIPPSEVEEAINNLWKNLSAS